jgi:hypothetical protein
MDEKQLTSLGCCDKVDITSGTTYVMFGRHKYIVHVSFCKNCGSQKEPTSYIRHVKEDRYERHFSQSVSR